MPARFLNIKGCTMNKMSLSRQKSLFVFTSIAIPVVLLVVFVMIPALDLMGMSFTSWDGLSPNRDFIGLDNYRKMLGDKDLWLSLRNNFIYFFIHLLAIPVELAIAVMLSTKMRAVKFFKSMTFLPYVVNGVAMAYAFSYFFSPINGGFNAILSLAGLESLIRNWLSDEEIVNYVLASVSLWRFSGYHIILFIAALTSIPQDIVEAATIDGAGAWQKFWRIQVPSITLVVDFILFDNVRGALQVFEIPFIITNGGPGYASSTFTLYTINTAFQYRNFGLASSMAVAIMCLIIVVHFIQNVLVNNARRQSEKRYNQSKEVPKL